MNFLGSKSYYQVRLTTFFQSSYQTLVALWGSYSQTILQTFQDFKQCSHFQRVIVKQYNTLFQSLRQAILTFSEGAGFSIQGSRVQNHWVAPKLIQPFILPRSIKWVPGISVSWMVKSKLPPWSGSSLETEPHP